MASPADPDPDPDQLANLLLVLEHARADAWLRRDRRALEALLDAGFIEINLLGRFTRDDLLARLFPALVLQTFTIEDPKIHILNKTAAALTYQCYEELTVTTKKIRGNFHVSSLYTRPQKQWKLALWQITPYTGKGRGILTGTLH